MCGIAGIVSNQQKVAPEPLKRMTDVISHRGPDGEGQWINSSGGTGLGHRRLSIIDLSADGAQPMHFGEGRYTITFNGEIYNYIELKDKLLKQGVKFRSQSDTEVLMALYALKREKCLDELDGMFAFAIWDELEKTLFCARDRFGEKPFYYHHEPGKVFIFGSEIKQLFASGLPRNVNNRMAFNFLNNRFMLSNPSVRSETFFDGISKLEPAHYLLISADLKLTHKRYWDIDRNSENKTISFDDAAIRFRELFERSTKRRLRADVPVGSSLSGGIDSSTIVCLIDQINHENKISQKTFSARFKDFAKDEGKFMEAVISRTKAEAHFTWPDETGFVNDIDKLIYHQDEPFASASIFAQWCVMKLAKENNVTVLIDGQGADEMLAGYLYYFPTYLKQLYKQQSPLYPEELDVYRSRHNPVFQEFRPDTSSANQSLSIATQTKRALKNVVRPFYRAVIPAQSTILRKAHPFLSPEYTTAFSPKDLYNTNFEGSLKDQLYLNTCVSGLEDLLRYADRNSMAFSREVRLPFLEKEMVEFIFSLPSEYKISKGWTKILLRKAFEDIMPPEISWRVDKIGYEPPQTKWMANPAVASMVIQAKEKLEKEHVLNPNRDKGQDNDWSLLMAGKMLF
ncbi:MAG TPA: asparagine synthase (glutamine-hydrolyzing) [Bacteroidia bacterium]|jgi:asparagine synthase (glutamine-hydrolysing)|nr:asparagine synthase (glutamine-hydrolyzing) [Bacteroidia bacterium]